MEIRRVAATDLSALAELIAELAAHHGDASAADPARLSKDVLGPEAWFRTLVADEGGALVGHVSLLRVGQLQFGVRGVDMHHLHVTHAARGRGFGRRLVKAAIAEARAMGAAFVVVGAAPDNVETHGFYESMGFERRTAGSVRFAMRLGAEP